MQEVEREYRYKDGRGMMGLLGILMLILGPLAAYIEHLEPMSMDLDIGITLNPHQAVWFMGALGIVLMVSGGAMLRSVWRSPKQRPRLAFTADSLIFHDPLIGEERAVAYSEITDVSTSTNKGQQFLHFSHPGGNTTLAASMLKNKRAIPEIAALLNKKIEAHAVVAASNPPVAATEYAKENATLSSNYVGQ